MTALIEETTFGNRLLPRIVLIACGSFNPPTLMHFRMFEIARDYFEAQGTHQVVGGIVSPTHDAYGKKGLIEAKHRCAMVKLALQSSNWIRLSDWETQQQEWSRTLSVLQHHQNYINNYIKSDNVLHESNELLPAWLPPGLRERSDHVQLRMLCGADLLESFAVPGLWADEDIANIIGNHGLVVITRSGANPEKFIFDSDILTKFQRNITLVTNWVTNDVSSTMIRRLVGRGMSVKYLIDDLVLEYIKQQKLFNYKLKYITDVTTTAHTPMQLVYNVEYANQVQQQQQQQQRLKVNNKNSKINDNNKNANNNVNNNNDVLRPTTQTTIISKITNTKNDESDDEISEDSVERMDETDFAMKNILNSFHLNQKAKVFCCGETDKLGSKLLHNRRSSPGQAVRTVIMAECSGSSASGSSAVNKERLREAEELKPKKMKITAPQNV